MTRILSPARLTIVGLVLTLVSACAQPDPAVTRGAPFDPYEAENRRMHNFNRSVDSALVRPAGRGYSKAIPDDIETVIGNFSNNLSLPAAIVNNVLQGNGKGATEDFYRFVVNTTIGLGGLFDTATDLNMPAQSDADFGQTLYAWGVNEGPYLELPLLGPSTTRDAVGKTVDLFTNPLSYAVKSPESFYGTGASVSASLSARGRYSDAIDSILYESADSYAASRSLYLQNRRFKVGKGGSDDYLDPYDTGSAGPSDPYGDPYDE
ncbi:VacJ family lipoprotein [Pseudohalocynthiibacter aestuariivivens]|nr:VacJ family lipoprotein [Pseudohalocynthiibacter aestuariivivens]